MKQRAFTMIEILVVISVIVLVIAMAVPAINFLTGSKSTESAQNTISAMLGRARNQAIGLQQVSGVFFYLDPISNLTTMAIVKDVGSSITPNAGITISPEVYLDLVESDVATLPAGVSVQLVDDGSNPATLLPSDRYLGFNNVVHDATNNTKLSSLPMNYGGVILFDGDGRLVRKIYAFQVSTGAPTIPPAPPPILAWTAMGKLFETSTAISANLGVPTVTEQDWIPGIPAATEAGGMPERSQVGLVVFDHTAFTNAGGGDDDPQVTAGNNSNYSASSEPTEETWLDNNATLLLINRYNGTVVKGE